MQKQFYRFLHKFIEKVLKKKHGRRNFLIITRNFGGDSRGFQKVTSVTPPYKIVTPLNGLTPLKLH